MIPAIPNYLTLIRGTQPSRLTIGDEFEFVDTDGWRRIAIVLDSDGSVANLMFWNGRPILVDIEIEALARLRIVRIEPRSDIEHIRQMAAIA